MTKQEIIALAKGKLGNDITEQEAQNYLDGKTAIPDEALELVSGGGNCWSKVDVVCPRCGSRNVLRRDGAYDFLCKDCTYYWNTYR